MKQISIMVRQTQKSFATGPLIFRWREMWKLGNELMRKVKKKCPSGDKISGGNSAPDLVHTANIID